MSAKGTEVVVEVRVGAPPADVWRALSEPAEVRRWFGWGYEGIEEEIDAIFGSGPTASEEDRTVDTGGDRIVLEPEGDATVVRVVRDPPDGPADASMEIIDQGWLSFVQALRFALERHPGEDRWTLRLSGRPREGDATPLTRALGLEDATARGSGERYDTVTAVGEPLSGEVWFTTDAVTGLTVEAYGDGLVVLATESAQASPPHGRVSVLVSAYGLGEDERERLRERWTDWWVGHFGDTSATAGPG